MHTMRSIPKWLISKSNRIFKKSSDRNIKQEYSRIICLRSMQREKYGITCVIKRSSKDKMIKTWLVWLLKP